jgi:hypothetical protein
VHKNGMNPGIPLERVFPCARVPSDLATTRRPRDSGIRVSLGAVALFTAPVWSYG